MSSVSASTEAWPSPSISASRARTASSGWPSAAAIRAAAQLERGVDRLAGPGGGVEDQPRLGGPSGVEQAVDQLRGEEQPRRSVGSAAKAACAPAKLAASRKAGAAPPSASQRPWFAGAGRVDRERPVGRAGAALDRAGEIGEERRDPRPAPAGKPLSSASASAPKPKRM